MNRLRIFLLKLAQINFSKAKSIYKEQRDRITLLPDIEHTLWFEGSTYSAAVYEFQGTFLYELATIGIKK